MKLIKLTVFLFLVATCGLSAQQISEHALGLRLGDSDGFGAEISYQKSNHSLVRNRIFQQLHLLRKKYLLHQESLLFSSFVLR